MEYKQTLNMNKSGFPMRGGLPMREPDMLKHWQELDLYNELLKKNEGKPLFALHDGPPFSNGSLHMGHALNKCLKDFMVRSAAMRGYYTPYIPGWDNHGMPIESAIIKQNKLNHKAMPIPEFRSACHDFAQHYIDVQMEGFKRLGVVADWEHPYKTMAPSFEAEEVKVFGAMYKKGYIYKGLKPVYWCYHDETALAEAEIEYQDDPCTTVYVKFPLHDDQGKLTDEEKKNLSFVIWTTTIWTLPGNLAIALNPVESYVIVRNNQNGEQYLVAEALMEKVMKVGGVEDYTVVSRHEGAFFENMLADHPFLPKTSRLVLADYVTMDSGTGCVHTAPGFGADDYQTCRRYGMDMVVPVNDQGRHTDYAGKYAGMLVEESNPVILKDMQEAGSLFASEQIVHSYPHCWRCKKPIIFRATPQWFCSVDSFKDEACAACDDVRWVPGWGIDRMKSMIRERADWCISRQRRWGLPIPVFYCKDCGKPICTDETIKAVSDLFAERAPTPGSIWTPPTSCPRASPAPTAARPPALTRRRIPWTAGSTPAPPTLPLWSAIRASGLPPCTSRAWISIAAGSSPPCWWPWARWAAALRSRSASPTAGPWTARARPCTSLWATAWTPPRSSTSTAPICCVCGPAAPTTTWTSAAPTRSSSS